MNVLSVIHHPVFGGPHNRHAHIVPILADHGVNVTVLLPDEPGNAAERLRGRGVDVVTIPLDRIRDQIDLRVQLRFARSFRRNVKHLRAVIRDRRVDAVLVNGLLNAQAGVAAFLEGVPVVWQLLDSVPPMWFRRLMMPLVLRLADALMTTGMAVARAHPGAVGFDGPLLPFFPPVDMERFQPDPSRRAAARRELGLEPDDRVIGNVGNLVPMKGHANFLRGAAELRRTHPDVRFVLLGAAPQHRDAYLASLRRKAAELGLREGVDLIIRDPESRVSDLASAFDVFWLTSEANSEGLPTVSGEAMALALPVVATDVGALRESIDDGNTGLIVAPSDHLALARCGARLLDHPDLRARMGRQARVSAYQRWDARICAHRHLEAFRAASARHSDAKQ